MLEFILLELKVYTELFWAHRTGPKRYQADKKALTAT